MSCIQLLLHVTEFSQQPLDCGCEVTFFLAEQVPGAVSLQ